jgi:hypothetical protein
LRKNRFIPLAWTGFVFDVVYIILLWSPIDMTGIYN